MEKYLGYNNGMTIYIVDVDSIKIQISNNILIIMPYKKSMYDYIKKTCLRIAPRLENPLKIFKKLYNTAHLQKPFDQ